MPVTAVIPTVAPTDPTAALYGYMHTAYDYFNCRLFEGKLPPCLFLYRGNSRSLGHYHGDIFEHVGTQARVDELAINPQFMSTRSPEEVLSTLVHEMCHHWQKHFGKEPSRSYHDKQWAEKMESIGLQPTHNGLVGGKRTGPHMTHLIIDGGRFAVACSDFLQTAAPVFYQDRNALRRTGLTLGGLLGLGGDGEGEEGGAGDEQPALSKGRAKFVCPTCKLKAWAKPGAKLICGDDNVTMERTDGND